MSIDQVIRLIDILAWLGTALLLLRLMRKPLRLVIPYVQRIKYKYVEIEFSKKLAEVAADFSESPLLESGELTGRDEIYTLAGVSPVSAIVEAWKGLDQAAQEKLRQLMPKGETYKKPLRRPVDYLYYKGALVPSAASAARDLRLLRNELANAGAQAVSREDAIQYAALADRIKKQIEAITEFPTLKLTTLTLLILELNHLIDSKKYDDITIDDAYRWIKEEAILPLRKARTVGDSYLRFLERMARILISPPSITIK